MKSLFYWFQDNVGLKKADDSVFINYDNVIKEIKQKVNTKRSPYKQVSLNRFLFLQFNIPDAVKENITETIKEEVEHVSQDVIDNYNKVITEFQNLQSKIRDLAQNKDSDRVKRDLDVKQGDQTIFDNFANVLGEFKDKVRMLYF